MSYSTCEDESTSPSSSSVCENTPLLGTTTHKPVLETLPKLQIFVLCYARVVEPLAFFGIFPFISEMIFKTGNVEEADVGFYAGLIESLFSLTQMMLMIQWGRAADRIGRKPVLVFSLVGVAIAMAIFGLSKTLWQMILFRCCAGIFSGSVVTVRAMITENSTPQTKARAFSFFALSTNVGIFLGPAIGGALADPAKEIGGIFKHIEFFSTYPYSLPTLVSSTIGVSAAILCAVFLKETFKRRTEGGKSLVEAPMSILELIRAPGVGIVLFFYAHVMLIGIGHTAVSPVFWFTEPKFGGYGLTKRQISWFVGGGGICQALWLLFAFPTLQRRYGTRGVLCGCLFMWPILFAATPVPNYFLRQGWTTLFWITAPMLQIGGSGVAMAFTAVQLALNDISPSPTTLGTLNGIALTLTASIRTVGPPFFTSLFAVGARTQFLSGYLVWAVLAILAALGSVAAAYLLETAKGKLEADDEGEDN